MSKGLKDEDRVTLAGRVYVVWECQKCMMIQVVPETWYNWRRKSGETFYCCNGHQWSFSESEADRMRRERDRAIQQQERYRQEAQEAREREEAAERRASAAKGQVTKLKKRASAGVCPCCNRSFQNLRQHMESKHPNYGKAAE